MRSVIATITVTGLVLYCNSVAVNKGLTIGTLKISLLLNLGGTLLLSGVIWKSMPALIVLGFVFVPYNKRKQ